MTESGRIGSSSSSAVVLGASPLPCAASDADRIGESGSSWYPAEGIGGSAVLGGDDGSGGVLWTEFWRSSRASVSLDSDRKNVLCAEAERC